MTDQAKAMTAGEKVANIEQTVGKNNVRNSVARQTEEYLYYMQEQSKCPSVMRIASLAAENWYSEYLLKNYLEHSWLLTNPPELHFISAERSKSVANRSYVNMPDNATVLKGNFSDIFKKPFKTARAGLFMVVLITLVDTLAYMAEMMSNRSKKARKARI